eukprot:TRINITY_DN15500_c0_g1_i1.p1 TRINITY_DN15500_c0_g1~~TRINITY_DN15500_c0_g1_i1.p1  ORF type:complete len:718 (+),score=245.63 TRINITY_DN15500_c0_g1_i1:81-2234(+)
MSPSLPQSVTMHPALVATFGPPQQALYTACIVRWLTSHRRHQLRVLLVAADDGFGELVFVCDTDGTIRRLVPVTGLKDVAVSSTEPSVVLLRTADPAEPDILYEEADDDFRNLGMPRVLDTVRQLRAARGSPLQTQSHSGHLHELANFQKGVDYLSPRRKLQMLGEAGAADPNSAFVSPTPTDSMTSVHADRTPRSTNALCAPQRVPLHPRLLRHFGPGVGAYTARVIFKVTRRGKRQMRVALVTGPAPNEAGDDHLFVCDGDGTVRSAVELSAIADAVVDRSQNWVLLRMMRQGEPALLYCDAADARNDGMPGLLDTIAAARSARGRPLSVSCPPAGAMLDPAVCVGRRDSSLSPRRKLMAAGGDASDLVSATPTNSELSLLDDRPARPGSPVFKAAPPPLQSLSSVAHRLAEETPWSKPGSPCFEAESSAGFDKAEPADVLSSPPRAGHWEDEVGETLMGLRSRLDEQERRQVMLEEAQGAIAAEQIRVRDALSASPPPPHDCGDPLELDTDASATEQRGVAYARARDLLAGASLREAPAAGRSERRRKRRERELQEASDVERALRSASEQVAVLIDKIDALTDTARSRSATLSPPACTGSVLGSSESIRRHNLRQQLSAAAANAARRRAQWASSLLAATSQQRTSSVRSSTVFAPITSRPVDAPELSLPPQLQHASHAELDHTLSVLHRLQRSGAQGLGPAIAHVQQIQLQHRA